ncbi:NADH-quinone oxidoreductase subunit NuoN [Oxalobacter paraformigenes]|uniref:NADH-quinone oxidoreductase subunit N n=1 Tax=Oxalobacter paraformigenes TaxID=556268 RepID=C3X4P4_9BURK|nr:NADH-quinone oxidoreductase subunit NuoN [Oxalobacter paraformigenes]EEO28180.1 proton-translocating NADH-quinone oxidoreductase, chain N [Oxalobacter paraformigenes]
MNSMNLIPALPEVILIASVPLILLIDLFLPQNRRDVTFGLSVLAIGACAVVSFIFLQEKTIVYTFGGAFVSDAVSNLLKLCTYFAMLFTLVYSRRYINERNLTSHHLGGEFYVLALFSMLGQMVVISAADFLTMYLGIELMSFPLYALVAIKRDDGKAVEAATKFFILGALGSGLLLYGISMLYGATGALDFMEIAKISAYSGINRTIMVFGLVFVVAGIAFKLGAVPFHMWVPDVFEGAPTAVTLLVAGAPKLAGFAICLRILVEALLPMAFDWQQMLVVIAVLSMALGNVTAIMQKNIKRMLAYSTIAQMGYMLLGMLAGVKEGMTGAEMAFAYSSAMYYTIVYVLATLGAFGVILMMSKDGVEADTLSDFRGLNRRNPWYALIMLLCMFSFAGVPPLVGFYGKLAVFQAVINVDMFWLAVVGIFFAVVGAFYYLRVIKLMYFDEPADGRKIRAPWDMAAALGINGMLILLLGILPGPLMDLCVRAVYRAFLL